MKRIDNTQKSRFKTHSFETAFLNYKYKVGSIDVNRWLSIAYRNI